MINHLQNRALNAAIVEREQPQHHKAKMADGGIGDQLLHVFLRVTHDGPVDNAYHGEHGDSWRKVARGFREEAQVKA